MFTLDFPHAVARLCQLAQSGADRTLVALAGAPGSGKSTLARDLAAEVNRRAGLHAMVALGMDGFHLPKAALRAMPNAAAALARRGAPWTFDPAAMAAQLDVLRHSAGVTWCGWPAFEHGTGDPVPRANAVAPPTRVVLVEGLYVLHREDGWAPVAAAFDEHWFLDTPLDLSLERLAARHMASWKMTREQADARIAGNDRLNADVVLASRAQAQWLVTVEARDATASA
jgi:pantothenate kinase